MGVSSHDSIPIPDPHYMMAARMGIIQPANSGMEQLINEMRTKNEEDCQALEKLYNKITPA